MRRHLTVSEVTAALRHGSSVEQLLGFREPVAGRSTLAYVWLSGGSVVTGRLERRFDDGSPDFFDVGAFQPLEDEAMDEWDPFAGPPPDETRTFDSPDDALEWARSECAASDRLWVNGGLIGDEYRDAKGW